MTTDLIKKARYLSHYRGTKEADRLIGGFVDDYLTHSNLTNGELETLCEWLYLDDLVLLRTPHPAQEPHPLSRRLHIWMESRP